MPSTEPSGCRQGEIKICSVRRSEAPERGREVTLSMSQASREQQDDDAGAPLRNAICTDDSCGGTRAAFSLCLWCSHPAGFSPLAPSLSLLSESRDRSKSWDRSPEWVPGISASLCGALLPQDGPPRRQQLTRPPRRMWVSGTLGRGPAGVFSFLRGCVLLRERGAGLG